MARQQISLKQLAINKDNTMIIVAVGLASFVIVFSLIASKALLEQRSYQSKVITKKQKARDDLAKSEKETQKLKASYLTFAENSTNVLGGSSTGTGPLDGDNARLILDALPSKYDFPALTSSLEKVFRPYGISSIQGTDDEVTQSSVVESGSPTLVEIPFAVTLTTPPEKTTEVLETFEKSIRPIQIKKLILQQEANNLRFTVNSNTYFQGPKKFDVKTEKVSATEKKK